MLTSDKKNTNTKVTALLRVVNIEKMKLVKLKS